MQAPILPPSVLGLRSSCCDRVFTPDAGASTCPIHGDAGTLDVVYDYGRLRAEVTRDTLAAGARAGMWRYLPLLPIHPQAPLPALRVGDTPLYPAPALAGRLGLAQVWVKDEGRQPTGSLKDRASALAVALAKARGASVVTTASTGNAAAALAGLCAGTGMEAVIFVPAGLPPAKLAQLLVYGARVVLVEGSYDDAFALCQQVAGRAGWYVRSTGVNPFMTEGKKTVVYEILESLNWSVPDAIVVGVGDGCIVGALHKGLRDLLALGWIDRLPRLIGVQAAGSDYLYQAWRREDTDLAGPGIATGTLADSMAAGLPRDRFKAMAAIRDTDGAFVRVGDEAILAAIPQLARAAGVFAEPAGASALAGLHEAIGRGIVKPGERVVLIATGNGLKDIHNAGRSVGDLDRLTLRCAPTLAHYDAASASWQADHPAPQPASEPA
jgi:threonine synthase